MRHNIAGRRWEEIREMITQIFPSAACAYIYTVYLKLGGDD